MAKLSYVQLHNLESILGDLRGSSSDFYPDQAGNAGASDPGSKPQGCLDDNLRGKWHEEQKLYCCLIILSSAQLFANPVRKNATLRLNLSLNLNTNNNNNANLFLQGAQECLWEHGGPSRGPCPWMGSLLVGLAEQGDVRCSSSRRI